MIERVNQTRVFCGLSIDLALYSPNILLIVWWYSHFYLLLTYFPDWQLVDLVAQRPTSNPTLRLLIMKSQIRTCTRTLLRSEIVSNEWIMSIIIMDYLRNILIILMHHEWGSEKKNHIWNIQRIMSPHNSAGRTLSTGPVRRLILPPHSRKDKRDA